MYSTVIRSIYTTNFGVKPNEAILVFTDLTPPDEILTDSERCRRLRLRDIAMLTAEVGRSFSRKVCYLEYAATGSHGVEPPLELWHAAFGPKAVAALAKSGLLQPVLNKTAPSELLLEAASIIRKHASSAVNIVIALANYSTSHTRFREFLTRCCGARYASMPLFDASMLEGALQVNWKNLARRTRAIAKTVNEAESVEVTTPFGTRISFSKAGRKALPDTGILTRPDSFSNLPAGEVFFAPVEGTAKGTLVLFWGPTREFSTPVTLTVKDGRVVEISGTDPYADILRAKLDERPENRNIAELGIGTNERAVRPDNILESEKILGTIHIALGDNSSFGGTVKAPYHQDFVFFRPTVTLISQSGAKSLLMKNGLFCEAYP
ncbi:MAG TPA: aminopeptidase [Dissulfurispiraceae bacterium]|nr:aminopeptidase [Dissulfurispiraceae bacterium]